jgi:hypothetical protein
MKVFWFFFSKKNRKKALLFEKRSKNFYPFGAKTPKLHPPDCPGEARQMVPFDAKSTPVRSNREGDP